MAFSISCVYNIIYFPLADQHYSNSSSASSRIKISVEKISLMSCNALLIYIHRMLNAVWCFYEFTRRAACVACFALLHKYIFYPVHLSAIPQQLACTRARRPCGELLALGRRIIKHRCARVSAIHRIFLCAHKPNVMRRCEYYTISHKLLTNNQPTLTQNRRVKTISTCSASETSQATCRVVCRTFWPVISVTFTRTLAVDGVKKLHWKLVIMHSISCCPYENNLPLAKALKTIYSFFVCEKIN